MKYYVYLLIDPRDGRPFYVGKGCGDRIQHHEAEARSGRLGAKCERIREIFAAGLQIKREIESRHEDEAAAYAREYELMCSLAGLTNIAKYQGRPGSRQKKPKLRTWADLFIEVIEHYRTSKGFAKAVAGLLMAREYPWFVTGSLKEQCYGIIREHYDELMQFIESNQDLFGPNGKLA